jgi:hypothetical protein
MKAFRLFFLIAAFLAGCSNSNLFAPTESEKNTDPFRGPSGQSTFEVQITGGVAGVSQQLVIDANRHVRYTDVHPQQQLETVIAAEEYNQLVTLFVEKDFLHMQSTYINAEVVDAFLYRILFRYGGVEKQVETDYFGAPPELRVLVDQLIRVIDTLLNKSLALKFKTSADTLRHGEKLTMTLIATNRSSNTLTLHFRSGQFYDFFATPLTPVLAIYPPPVSWNWAYDKAFIQILQTIPLQPNESLTYSAEWDGRSNKGDLLIGTFLLGGRLVSIPGGYTPMRSIVVRE